MKTRVLVNGHAYDLLKPVISYGQLLELASLPHGSTIVYEGSKRGQLKPDHSLMAEPGMVIRVVARVVEYAGRTWLEVDRSESSSRLSPCDELGEQTGEDHCVVIPHSLMVNLRQYQIQRRAYASSGQSRR